MKKFYEVRPYLENEFEEAQWIPESGIPAGELSEKFDKYLQENDHLPTPLLRAGALEFLLDNCQIAINPHSIYCHKLNLGVNYNHSNTDGDFLKKQLHEAGPDIMENQMFYPRNRRFQEELAPVQAERNRTAIQIGAGRAFCDYRHACPDWNNVFALGFKGLRDRVADYKAKKEAAEAKYKQAVYQFRQSLLDAGVEVNNAISLWETAKKRVEIDKKQIISLQAAVLNTQLLMKHGNANYLEVLTAQKNLLQAELGEVSDRYDEFQSVVNLYHALGGGY